ncbi:MAG TPA: hypothetical protein VF629_02195 [Hymenobacter sp.]|jgi:hypothetical protein|uniref:hypothetical protein n=1 Tax=Hymenobacter sp. TaxID=1898978 RepID=UPI002ED79E24
MNKCLLFLGDVGGSEMMLLMLIVGPVLLIIHFIPSFIARKRPDFFMVLLSILWLGGL